MGGVAVAGAASQCRVDAALGLCHYNKTKEFPGPPRGGARIRPRTHSDTPIADSAVLTKEFPLAVITARYEKNPLGRYNGHITATYWPSKAR